MRSFVKKNTLSILLISMFSLSSCMDYLDVAPTEFNTENDLLADVKQAEKEIAVLYARLPWDFNATDGDNGMNLSAASDEGYHNWNQSGSRDFDGGSWMPDNNRLGNYSDVYNNVRIGYHFLENIDKVPIKNEYNLDEYKNVILPRYKAEVKFLIAFYYFELFKRYGAVTIIDRYYNPEESSIINNLPRNSVDEVIAYITKLCDEASAALPNTYELQSPDLGRATKGAAMALKAKALIYAASPLFNGGELDGQEIVVDGIGVKNTLLGVKNPDGKTIFNQSYDKEKWNKAAIAAKAVIDLAELENLYHLNPDRSSLFYSRDFNEVIFWKQGGGSDNWEQFIVPNGSDYGGYGALSAPQEMIDSYEMSNGYPISNSNSGYTASGYTDTLMNVYRNNAWLKVSAKIRNMYVNRDPRFYTDQFFNGMPYLGRKIITDYQPSLGQNSDGWGKSGQNTRTGYYVKKWVNPTQNLKSSTKVTSYRNMPFIRLADVYLWYAEALNEYQDAPSQEVYDAINKVRSRVGMPSLPILPTDNTKAGMRERIRNERKVELAYEGQRFFDIRRWMIAHTTECKKVTGLSINAAGDAFYVLTPVLQNGRVFNLNHYLMPIPTKETTISKAIVQNYGWMGEKVK